MKSFLLILALGCLCQFCYYRNLIYHIINQTITFQMTSCSTLKKSNKKGNNQNDRCNCRDRKRCPLKACGNDNYHFGPRYPRTEAQLIQEIKTDLNTLERNLKANSDTPAVADIWDLIYASKFIGTPAFTRLIIELNKSSERVLNLLREYYPRPKSLRHMKLISSMKDLIKSFAHQAKLQPNKVQMLHQDFLNYHM